MNFVAQIIVWINVLTNALAKVLLAPIAHLPGWLSNTIISAVVGVLLLIIFKYTSNQKAIEKVRDSIKANLLALKLYKDSIAVTLKAQGKVFQGAFLLLFHAIRPMLVMIVPVSLILAQMGLWYQFRPLNVGEQTLVIMELNGDANSPWPVVKLDTNIAAEITIQQTKVLSKRQVYWKIKALEEGYQKITFLVDDQHIEKQFAAGDGFMKISPKKPAWNWAEILLYPTEKPFAPDSAVKSISILYPERISKTSGADWWIVYFFIASMVFALIFKPFLKVKI